MGYTSEEIILAAMSASFGEKYQPVQIQKFLFMIDQEGAKYLGGKPFFNFEAYHYGPYDKNVYALLDALSKQGLVEIESAERTGTKRFGLTWKGQEKGLTLLKSLPENMQAYFSELDRVIRSMSFHQLVSAIYKKYPEMKTKSIFNG